MAASILRTTPSFYAKVLERGLFNSANTYEKHIVCKDYFIANHDEKTCLLPACKYHNILLGEIEELLHKLDTLCFAYQHVDCLYTLFKYRFIGKNIAKSGNVFENVQRAISFNQKNRGVEKIQSFAKKRLVRKKIKQLFMSALQKNKSTQTSGCVCRKNSKSQKD